MYLLPLVALAVTILFLVEVFSIAMKMTGLDIEKARFQVLTLLTSTGFTTRESELIVQHPVRRKIAKIVMIFGYVATASIVTILFKALLDFSESMWSENFLYLGVGIALLLVLILVITNKRLINRLDHFIEYRLLSTMKKNNKRTVDEVLKLNEEYGVAEVILGENSPFVGKALKESGLKQNYIQVLNIEGATHMIHFPTKDNIFEMGDKVVVYGKLKNIIDFMQ